MGNPRKQRAIAGLGSAAAMMALSAGSPAVTAAAASPGPGAATATLTADVQQAPPAGAQPPSSASSTASPGGTSSTTFASVSDFLSAAGTRVQNAFGAVSDAFGNIMTTYGQTQVEQARGSWVFWNTLPYALPNAVQAMKEDGDAGLLGGTGIGLALGGVPGAGVGLEIGAGGGATEGFLRGLLYAPVPHEITQQYFDQFNSLAAGQGTAASNGTGPVTGFPQGLAGELGLGSGGPGIATSPGTGTPASPWPTDGNQGQQPAGPPDGAGTGTSVRGDLGSPAGDGASGESMVAGPDTSDGASGEATMAGTVGSDGASGETAVAGTDASQQIAGVDPMTPVSDPSDLASV